MASDKKICAYFNCDLGENGSRKKFYGTKRALYCCGKHGTYQRRLNKKRIKEGESDDKKSKD